MRSKIYKKMINFNFAKQALNWITITMERVPQLNLSRYTKYCLFFVLVTTIFILNSYSNVIKQYTAAFSTDTIASTHELSEGKESLAQRYEDNYNQTTSQEKECVKYIREWKSLALPESARTITRSALAEKIENFFLEFAEEFPQKPLTDSTQDVLTFLQELERQQVQIVEGNGNPDHRGKLHILASYHSGSTFTGNLFHTHPSVYSMFEPLIFLDLESTWSAPRRNQHLISKHLSNLLNCSFMDTMQTSFALFDNKDGRRLSFLHRSFPGGTRKKGMSQKEILTSANAIERVCKEKFNYTSIKTIRCESLLSVLPSIIRGINTIQLLRDPRGLFASRIGYLDKNAIGEKRFKFSISHMTMECSKNERNFKFLEAISQLPAIRALFDAHFRFVRYEDIAYDTLTLSQAMFEFAGIRMSEHMLQDIVHLASSTDFDSNLNSTSIIENVESDKSKAIATKWRHKVPIEFIRVVEGTCYSTLKELSYNIFLDDKKYREDKYELVNVLNSRLFQTFKNRGV